MRDALTSLPWVKEAKVDYNSAQAVITVDPASYDAEKLIAALKKDGYGAQVKSGN